MSPTVSGTALYRPLPAMVSLPDDILRNIIQNLSLTSACNLARTCRYIQPFAEAVIWSDLDLISHSSDLDTTSRLQTPAPQLSSSTQTNLAILFEWVSGHLNCPDASNSLRNIGNLPEWIHGLRRCRDRVPYVKRLAVDITGRDYRQVGALLSLIQHQLVFLDIPATAFPLNWEPKHEAFDQEACLHVLRDLTLPKLKSLSVPISRDCQYSSIRLMIAAPRIESLTFSLFNVGDRELVKDIGFPVKFSNLRRLVLKDINDSSTAFFRSILEAAPVLAVVEISSFYKSSLTMNRMVGNSLNDLPGLVELAIPADMVLDFTNGFQHLRKLTLTTRYDACYSKSLSVG